MLANLPPLAVFRALAVPRKEAGAVVVVDGGYIGLDAHETSLLALS